MVISDLSREANSFLTTSDPIWDLIHSLPGRGAASEIINQEKKSPVDSEAFLRI